MKKVTLTEFKEFSFGTNILVHIKIDKPYYRDEWYNGVIVRDKIYYEDGSVDDRHTIEEYVYDNCATIFV